MSNLRSPLTSLFIAGSTIAAVLISGCVGGDPASEGRINRIISPVEASALIEEMKQDLKFVIIDVRRPDEYAGGHIPNAININSAQISERLESLNPDGTYLLCCQRGGRSAGAREVMEESGFHDVYEVEGGMSAWQAAGLPVVRG